jgi:hypothetical protein
VREGDNLEAVRAALFTLFDRFTLHQFDSESGPPFAYLELFVGDDCGYFLEPSVRPDMVAQVVIRHYPSGEPARSRLPASRLGPGKTKTPTGCPRLPFFVRTRSFRRSASASAASEANAHGCLVSYERGVVPATARREGTRVSRFSGQSRRPGADLANGARSHRRAFGTKPRRGGTAGGHPGQVTGTKRLLVGGPATCTGRGRGSAAVTLTALLTYDATITPPTGGTFTDTGEATVSTSGGCGFFGCRTSFVENFTLSHGVLPVDTTGKATGGGQLGAPTYATFGFEVKQPELGRLQGRCLVNDFTADTKIKCLDVTSYGQFGNTATWTGNATVNGNPETYRIIVQDNGESNQGVDTFSIKTQSYEAAGTVEHGDVQLNKQP